MLLVEKIAPEILLGGVLILQVIWYITDPRSPGEVIQSNLGMRGGFGRVTMVFMLIFFVFWKLYLHRLPLQFHSPFDILFLVIGICFYISGYILALWARLTMKEKWLPAGEGHNTERQHMLITSGPFRFSRNPIYLGLLLVYGGLGIAMRFYLTVLLLFFAYYLNKAAENEERMLEKIFGKEYLRYKAKVPRFM